MPKSQFLVVSPDEVDVLLERDGQVVVVSSLGDKPFVLRPVEAGDELVAIISRLDAYGKLKWEVAGGFSHSPSYYANIHGSGTDPDLQVSVGHRAEDCQNYFFLGFSVSGGRRSETIQPKQAILRLLERIDKRFGYSRFFTLTPSVELRELQEERKNNLDLALKHFSKIR